MPKIETKITVGNILTVMLTIGSIFGGYVTLQAQVSHNTEALKVNPPARIAVVATKVEGNAKLLSQQREDIKNLSDRVYELIREIRTRNVN